MATLRRDRTDQGAIDVIVLGNTIPLAALFVLMAVWEWECDKNSTNVNLTGCSPMSPIAFQGSSFAENASS